MNSFIASLNAGAERALDFGWPMLWQSSLLIGLLFALDFALRRKVRAAVRYALWCLLLVKLLLPPSLALPTSVAWWLRPSAPAPAAAMNQQKQPATLVVSYPDADASARVPARTILATVRPAPSSTPISGAAMALSMWSLISLGLLLWLGVRWRQVTKLQRVSVPAPSHGERSGLNELFESAKRLAGVRQPVPCRLIERPMSPAVCGLFRPVILLPRLLADQLPAEQLRTILLHELIHLRRRDVWVNCLQSLLQIFYWWHPLLWLANARIRRLREEAVDDAVMLALADQADAYAPTLLEVAKLAFYRPLTALGLVGILESRRGLRRRIERLMNFKTPRRAGLSVVSLLGMAAFTVLAMPMGEAPPKAPAPTLPLAQHPPAASHDLLGGKQLDPPIAPPVIQMAAAADTASSPFSADEPKKRPPQSARLIATSPGRQEIIGKLSAIRLDEIQFDQAPLPEVIRFLNKEVKRRDPDGHGINFVINETSPATIDPATGLPVPAAPSVEGVDINTVSIRINPPLNGVRIADVLDAIVKVADHPIKYSLEDYAIVFSLKGQEPTPLYIRRFHVDPNTFYQGLESVGAFTIGQVATGNGGGGGGGGGVRFVTSTNGVDMVSTAVINFFRALGVDLNPALGKSVFYNSSGDLLVRGTAEDHDRIEKYLVRLDSPGLAKPSEPPAVGTNKDPRVGQLVQRFDTGAVQSTPNQGTNLYIRKFKVDPNTFCLYLEHAGVLSTSNLVAHSSGNAMNEVAISVRKFFSNLGVNLDPPKSVFFNDREGSLLVRATQQDLDIIEAAVQTLNFAPPQINVKVRFVEVERGGSADAFSFYLDGLLLNSTAIAPQTGNSGSGSSNVPSSGLLSILTVPQYRVVLETMARQKTVNLFSESEVTTLSDRQAQIQVVDVKIIPTNIVAQALKPPGIKTSITNGPYEMTPMAFGPVLDVTPKVLPDGYTIQLKVSASMLEFLGYDDAGSKTAYINGKKTELAVPLARTRMRQVTSEAIVWDGQTLVLKASAHDSSPTNKNLLVFVTATIIDPTGQPVHPEEQDRAVRK